MRPTLSRYVEYLRPTLSVCRVLVRATLSVCRVLVSAVQVLDILSFVSVPCMTDEAARVWLSRSTVQPVNSVLTAQVQSDCDWRKCQMFCPACSIIARASCNALSLCVCLANCKFRLMAASRTIVSTFRLKHAVACNVVK